MAKFKLFAAAAALAFGASSAANAVTVVGTDCISVADSDGCLFDGNIAPETVQETQDAYNLYNDSVGSAQPDILLSYITKSDDLIANGDASNFSDFGNITGGGTSSGTWSLPGYLVNFVAVKAGSQFVLYQIAPASSGNWNTLDIPYLNKQEQGNPKALSHLAFFGDAVGVPEPATWAMMILGLGVAGAAMRRRQRQSVRYSFA